MDDTRKKTLREKIYHLKIVAEKIIKTLQAVPTCVEKVRAWDVDILYTNTSVIFIGALTAWVTGKPHVWHIRELKGVDFRYDLGNFLCKKIFKTANAQIFVSKALKKALSDYANARTSFVVYNGLISRRDLPENKNMPEDHSPSPFYTFCMVGTLLHSKGQYVALEALSYVHQKHPDIKLILAGTGHAYYINYLKELVAQLALEEHVAFLGVVSDPYQEVLAKADAYLMCSTNETFGRVTVEAMLSKLPVIGLKSEKTGTDEIVADNHTGLLFTEGATELANCMIRYVENPAWAGKLGENGFENAVERFTVEDYAARVHKILSYVRN